MKSGTRILTGILALCAVAFLIWLFPGSREIDVTVQAMEYRLYDDPNYAVEHTVVLKGQRTYRNTRFSDGSFKGTVSVSGIPELAEDVEVMISLSESGITLLSDPGRLSGWGTGILGGMYPSEDFNEFVWILENEDDDPDVHSYGGDETRFLVAGAKDRTSALALAANLTKGTHWEAGFLEK